MYTVRCFCVIASGYDCSDRRLLALQGPCWFFLCALLFFGFRTHVHFAVCTCAFLGALWFWPCAHVVA